MTILYLLIPVVLCMGLVALTCFLWTLRAGQYDDMSGAAQRILLDIDGKPLPRVVVQSAHLDVKEPTE